MDTSLKYVKMCLKAEPELRAFWKPASGDWVMSWVKDRSAVLYYNKHHGEPPDHYTGIATSVWLPRLDQLQDILMTQKHEGHGWHNDINYFRVVWYWITHFTNEIYPPHTFTSFEQVWLAFLMKELFNKKWDGATWEVI